MRTLKFYLHRPGRAWRQERREWERYFYGRKLDKLGLTSHYAGLPHGAYMPDWADLWNIYTLVRKRKPSLIWEFGSGCSTSIIASAMKENNEEGHPGEFVCFEESPYWLAATEAYMPEHVRDFCRIETRDAKIVEIDGQPTITHTDLPEQHPNFIYIDGPLVRGGGPIVSLGVQLEKGAPNDYFILIDGLGPTYRWTKKKLEYNYRFDENQVHYYRICERIDSGAK